MYANSEAFYNLVVSKAEINLNRLNAQVAEEQLTLYKKLGLDWIRVSGAYSSIPKNVKKLEDDVWQIEGSRYKWSGETAWFLDEPKEYDPDEIIRACKNSKIEVNSGVFDILRRISKGAKGEIFLSFDADGTWGPIVSNPNLLKHVLIWAYRRPDAVEALINHHTKAAIEYGKCAIDEGADAIQSRLFTMALEKRLLTIDAIDRIWSEKLNEGKLEGLAEELYRKNRLQQKADGYGVFPCPPSF